MLAKQRLQTPAKQRLQTPAKQRLQTLRKPLRGQDPPRRVLQPLAVPDLQRSRREAKKPPPRKEDDLLLKVQLLIPRRLPRKNRKVMTLFHYTVIRRCCIIY